MKKITKNILVIGGVMLLSSFVTTKVNKQKELSEIENITEDMIELIGYDVENGKIYKEYAEMYIENLEDILTKIKRIENE